MKLIASGLGLVLAVGAAGPLRAQTVPRVPPDCLDDSGVNRCDSANQRQVRERFGVRPIEALAAQGSRTRRAFYVDGYGSEMPVIAFVRAPGQEPRVSVVARVPEGAKHRLVEMSAAAPAPVWEEVLRRSAHFDRTLQARPEPPQTGSSVPPNNICLHSWVVTVEAVDPARGRTPAVTRRKTQDACGDSLTVDYGFELARLALEALPACGVLEQARHRNLVVLLQACALLSGDKAAAAEVLNAFDRAPVAYPDPPRAGSPLPPFTVNSEPRLDWGGEIATGWRPARELWSKVAAGIVHRPQRFDGESEVRVRVTGVAEVRGGAQEQTAPFEQIWVKEIGLERWAIESWSLGPITAPGTGQ